MSEPSFFSSLPSRNSHRPKTATQASSGQLSAIGFLRYALCALLIICGLWTMDCGRLFAAQVTLQWNPSPGPGVTGYFVYYGNSSHSYQYKVDAGNQTTFALTNLSIGLTYYIAVTAYNASHEESGFSNEVSYTVPQPCTFSITPTSQNFTSAEGTGTVNVTTQSGCTWTVVSNVSWIILSSNSTVTGNGTVNYTVLQNSGSLSRTGTMTIAGQTFTVSQQGVLQYTLTVNKSGTASGTVITSPQGTAFNQGTIVTLTATPDTNASFAGWSGGCTGVSPTCSLTMNSNASVTATFNLKPFTINATAGPNGSISPQGGVTVNYGASQTFTMTPAAGYEVSDVKIDGLSIGAMNSYSFGNVVANHTIAASFGPIPSSLIMAINAGGPEYINTEGTYYQADQFFTGGTKGSSNEGLIKGTVDGQIYQTERYGNFSYAIPLANGNYDLTLQVVENTFSSRGKRLFDVFIEGKVVLINLDIHSVVGKNTALEISFTVNVSDGILNMSFVPKTGDAQLSGILIKKTSSIPSQQLPWYLKRYFSTQQRASGQ